MNWVVLSTDDDAISAEALKYGAEVIRRPFSIACDSASSESALLHALDCLEEKGQLPTHMVLLQCELVWFFWTGPIVNL